MTVIGANLDDMGYRGDDGARERAAWGAQSPRQSSGEHAEYDRPGHDGPGYDSAGYDDSAYTRPSYDSFAQGDTYSQQDGYGQPDGYAPSSYDSGSYGAGRHSTGRIPADGYEAGNSYGTGSYGSGGYQSGSRFGTDSYGAGGTGGYRAGDYGSDDRSNSPQGNGPASYENGAYGGAYQSAPYDSSYDSTPHGADSYGTSSYASGSYPTTGHPSGGYPALGSGGYPVQGSGAYPALGSGGYPAQGSGGYPVLDDDSHDDGNDWYGRTGPQPAGFGDTAAHLALRDPVRGYPPDPGRADDGLAHTGQQLRYDESEHVTYPGYDGVDDEQGRGPRRDYNYDDYADYGTVAGNQLDQRPTGQREFETRLDQVAVDYDAADLGARGYSTTRGYGQALQGDDFDGGRYHDDYADASEDVLASVGSGARRGQGGGRGLDERNPGGPASPPPDAPRSTGAGRNGKPRRRRALTYSVTVGVVLLVAVAAVGGYKLMQSHQDNAAREANQPLPTSTASAGTQQQCAATTGEEFCHIEFRTDDPAPLTLSELYLPLFHSQADSADFLLQAEKIDTHCANALFGSELTSQVQTGKCTQVLRATYLSGDQTIMGTIGVVNLSTTNQAHYAGKVIGQKDFIQPLSTTKGLTAKIGQGIGVVEAEYKGHYLILTWAEFTNLKTPATPAQTQELENWENALVAGTANIYLSQRMINGDTSATVPSGSPSASGSTSPSATASTTS